jgi:aquaporin Z
MKKLVAEGVGTFVLVFGGCGSAVFAAPVIGVLGVSIAFGLTVLACAYALGPVSGCHLNPAVSVGLAVGGRFSWKEVPGYVGAQLVGGVVAAGLMVFLLKGTPAGYDASIKGLAANGFGDHSPDHYSLIAALVAEVVLTFIFLTVILGATSKAASPGQAGMAIGLTLTLVHLIGIPITNLSVNPARSTGPAIFVGGWALEQLWLFWVAPIVGAALAGLLSRYLHEE